MRVLRRETYSVGRADEFRIYPLGDIHLGAAACDEDKFRRLVDRIASEPSSRWIGMGDYADFINRSDPRFSPASLAPWITMADLGDLAKAQRDRFLDIIAPIAPQCIALVEGNHETAITRHYERSIFSEIVAGVKEAGGFPADHQLALGYYGWLQLAYYGSAVDNKKEASSVFNVNLHHGFGGGKLAGGKALNMQRWLWSHDCDLAIFGHTHNAGVQVEAIERIDRAGKVTYRNRLGCYSGTFLRTTQDGAATYAEVKGYMPMPTASVEVVLRPLAYALGDRIQVVSRY